MKKTMLIGLAIGVVALTATAAFATIEGSKHDLSSSGASASLGVDPQDRICVYCHHPHNTVKADGVNGSTSGLSYSPLWNRKYSDGGFSAYNNGTNMGTSSSSKHFMNGTPAVGGVSLLCMSCHDGVTAMNAYSNNNPDGATGSVIASLPGTTDTVITGVAALGTDLSNHHPIGMSWDDVTAGDNEIAQKSDSFRNTTITIGSVLTGGDTMECSACHDVHNSDLASRNNAERFLWTSNDGSEFCLSCHLK